MYALSLCQASAHNRPAKHEAWHQHIVDRNRLHRQGSLNTAPPSTSIFSFLAPLPVAPLLRRKRESESEIESESERERVTTERTLEV